MSKIAVVKAAPYNDFSRGKNLFISGAAGLDIIRTMKIEWMERNEELENNKEYRQLSPYVLVQHFETGDFVRMKRCQGQGEVRLMGKSYLGAGGHVEEGDDDAGSPIIEVLYNCAKRELEEELDVYAALDIIPQGLIIENGSDVAEVHLGILYHAYVYDIDFASSDESVLHEAHWVSQQDLFGSLINKEAWWSYEGWSRIVLKDYFMLDVPEGINL